MSRQWQVYDQVIVPDPNEDDLHVCEFTGTIVEIKNDIAVVEDGDGDCFDIETDRLTLADDPTCDCCQSGVNTVRPCRNGCGELLCQDCEDNDLHVCDMD
jgi:hypothetical protein